jgi:hypothetical protein
VLAACLLLVMVVACAKKQEEETAPAGTAPAAGGGTAFDPATGTATVTGKVAFEGAVPAAAQIKMNADPVCMSLHKEPVTSEEVLVADGKLQNVFVYVKEGLEKYSFTAPGDAATINQEGCHYLPHVGGMMVGQKLKIVNGDSTLHNIHCWAEKNPQFNIGQPVKGMETEKKFDTPEVMIHFKCDVHKWMSSYLGVLPHPYYGVSGKDGAFTLKNLPPGDYVIEAWHEKYGTQTQKVTVADKDSKEVNFTFKAS